MRVLYLTNSPYYRLSTTAPTEGWFRALRPRGLEPVLVVPSVGAFHAWAREQGIPCYAVRLPFPSKLRPWPFLRALWQLRRIVRKHGIQLIHCNEQEIYPMGQYLGRACGVPVVCSVQFTMEPGYSQWAFRGRRQPERLFFVSRGNREACRRGVEGVVPEAKWRILYNGVDTDFYRPDPELRAAFRREHGLEGRQVVGVACALRPRKQLEHLFAAAARVPQSDARVLLAGTAVAGDEAYADSLLQEARRQLGDRLVHLGHLDDLRSFYNALDLFMNTSQEEGCSLSVAESLACGTPVLGYPSTSVDEQILPGGGQIVPQDDVPALAEALAGWLGDAARLAAGRQGARRRAEEQFDIVKIADQLWEEYQSVVPDSLVQGRGSRAPVLSR
jgi:glycosyltransferase involved in cell wall biosynthesis